MMTLIGTAISVAFLYSAATVLVLAGMDFFWELATLIDVMLFGHWIEMKSVLGASRALEELVRVMPTNAHVLRDGGIVEVPVAELKKGDVVLVRPGEKIPSDGTVVEGESAVNEALLTVNLRQFKSCLKVRLSAAPSTVKARLRFGIEKTGEATYLAQVIKLVRQAQESKSERRIWLIVRRRCFFTLP